MRNDIACNPFVFRQTPESSFSYFAGSFDELVALVDRHFDKKKPADKPGSFRITLEGDEAAGFFSSVVECDEDTILESTFARRKGALPGELPCITVRAVTGKKTPAVVVDIVLYDRSVLTDEECTYTPPGSDVTVVVEAQWQIITINARATPGPEPTHPLTTARNDSARLGLPEGIGGTPANPTAEDYRVAILYWSRRAMFRGQ
jgi:hypothetical protein